MNRSQAWALVGVLIIVGLMIGMFIFNRWMTLAMEDFEGVEPAKSVAGVFFIPAAANPYGSNVIIDPSNDPLAPVKPPKPKVVEKKKEPEVVPEPIPDEYLPGDILVQ